MAENGAVLARYMQVRPKPLYSNRLYSYKIRMKCVRYSQRSFAKIEFYLGSGLYRLSSLLVTSNLTTGD